MEGRNGAQPGVPPWLILLMLSLPPNPPLKLRYSQITPPNHMIFGCFAEAIMAAEGEEGPRLGTTHPYLGPFVRYFNKQMIIIDKYLILQFNCSMYKCCAIPYDAQT